MSLNKIMLIGHLGNDPEVNHTTGGNAVAKFSVATDDRWTDREGLQQERTEWHRVVVWGKQAESCGEFLKKGRLVFVEGSIRTRHYDDKDGNKKYITEVVAQRIEFLGKPAQDKNRGSREPGADDAGW